MDKIVYVLGAGFSMDAHAPSQAALVKKIFETHNNEPHIFEDRTAIEKFKAFLTETLDIPESLHNDVPLEDVFTPLDKCLSDNITFRNLDVRAIKEIRGIIYYLIGKTLQHLLENSDKDYINLFAKYLVRTSSTRKDHQYRNTDPVSALSTNWDILLDNSLKYVIDSEFALQGVVDYCCHISSYKPHDESVKPGLEMLGNGGFNTKLIKLHGSLNWLQCPRCLRMYVDFDNKIAISQYVEKLKCRHCNHNFGSFDSHILLPNLIMPTYLKDLSNPQYKIIWQNAGIELSEAIKIVFIGYSLPYADFELRQLLSRMIRKDADIEVITFGDPDSEDVKQLKYRYKIFFGSRNIRFEYEGAKAYVLKNFSHIA